MLRGALCDERIGQRLGKQREIRRSDPSVFHGLQLIPRFVHRLRIEHDAHERGQTRVGRAKNKRIVPLINVGHDQGSRFRVRTRNDHVFHAYDVKPEPNRHEAVDVLCDGHEDLASHVPASFGPRGLVLNVNPCGTLFDKHFGELHDG